MPKQYGYKDIEKILNILGFKFMRQRGSHKSFVKKEADGTHHQVVVPTHKALAHGTFSAILRQIGIDREEFVEMLSPKKKGK